MSDLNKANAARGRALDQWKGNKMSKTYKQAFILTMENGAVVLAVVMGEDVPHGLGLAHAAAQDLEQCQIWDCAAFPTHAALAAEVSRLFIA